MAKQSKKEQRVRVPGRSIVRIEIAGIRSGEWAFVCGVRVDRRAIDDERCFDASGVQQMTLGEVTDKVIELAVKK